MNNGTSNAIGNTIKKVGNALKDIAKIVASKIVPGGGIAVELGEKIVKFLAALILIVILALYGNAQGVINNLILKTDDRLDAIEDFEVEIERDDEDLREKDTEYNEIIVQYLKEEHNNIVPRLQAACEKAGVDYNDSLIIDNSVIPTLGTGAGGNVQQNIVNWALEQDKDSSWRYVYFGSYGTKDKYGNGQSKDCPICKPDTSEHGWQCIGFVTACYFHGGGVPVDINRTNGKYCHLGGLGDGGTGSSGGSLNATDLLAAWKNKNGDSWIMIDNGGSRSGKNIPSSELQPADVILMYNPSGYCYHMAMYIGNGEYIDSSRGNKKDNGRLGGIETHKYEDDGHGITRAFRYTGAGSASASPSGGAPSSGAEAIAQTAEKYAWPLGTNPKKYKVDQGGTGYNGFTAMYQKHMGKNLSYSYKGKSYTSHIRVGACCCHSANSLVSEALGIKGRLPSLMTPTSKTHKKKLEKKGFTIFEYSGKISDLQRGDVITYSTSKGGHVAIYLGKKNGKHLYEDGGLITGRLPAIHQGSQSSGVLSKKGKNTYLVIRYTGKGGSFPGASGGSTSTATDLESYDSIKVLSEISRSDGRIKTYQGDATWNVTQSFALSDSGNIAVAWTSNPTTSKAKIILYDKNGRKLSNKIVTSYHSNASSGSGDGEIWISGFISTSSNEAVRLSDTSGTLKEIGRKTLPARCSSGLGYDKDTNKYIISAGDSILIYDSALNKCLKTISKKHGQYYQDLGAAQGIIYCCHSLKKGNQSSGSGDNYIDLYREEDGAYLGSYHLNYGELESAIIIDGELVILNNIKGTRKGEIQWTGIKVLGESNVNGADASGTRDVAVISAAFGVYDAELLPLNETGEVIEEKSWLGSLIQTIKDAFRRDKDPKDTLEKILKRSDEYLLKITVSNVVEKNGKKTAIVEIDHKEGTGLANYFDMDPNGKYTTESGKDGKKRSIFGSRQEGEEYDIGDTSIASAIETNTDTHLSLLYGNINGRDFEHTLLCLPLKRLFTSIDLSKEFDDDLIGIECKPKNNTKVYSCERGDVVQIVENDEKLGNYIVIQGYYKIIYAHLNTINVKKGDLIGKNKKIGTSTDLFRLEVYDDGVAVDPEPLFVKKIALGSEFSPFSGMGENGAADVGSGEYGWPVPGHTTISDPWGPRICPFHGKEIHTGVDIADSSINGAKVYASEAGKVTAYANGTAGGYGNCVVIEHSNGWKTAYCHLSKILVKTGDTVKRGDLIGKVGSTGDSTGAHLHWSLFKGGKLPYADKNGNTNTVDPMKHTTPVKTLKEMMSSGSINADSGKKGIYQQYAYSLFSQYGWGASEFEPLKKLWNRESGWNPKAKNSQSGAYGIPQSLPADKMKSEGSDYLTNYKTQIKWGLKYIKNRYGSPSKAWAHSEKKGWY